MKKKYLNRAEEVALYRQAKRGCLQSRNRLIENMMDFVWSHAHKASAANPKFDSEDLAQAALLKVTHVLTHDNKYNPGQSRFLTYFGKVALREMYEYIQHDGLINLPFGHESTETKRGKAGRARNFVSLDAAESVNAEGDFVTGAQVLEDRKTPPPEQAAAVSIEVKELRKIINHLPGNQATVVRLRMRGVTLKDVGSALKAAGIDNRKKTRERVRQIEALARKGIKAEMIHRRALAV